MKKYYFLIIVALILGLVLTGCTLLSNIGQVPTSEQSGIAELTKGVPFFDLVGLWHFSDNLTDSSGNNNDGVVDGATKYVDSLMGRAFSFDGDTCVSVDDSESLDITRATLEAWVKPSVSTQTSYARIVFKGTNNPFVPLYFLAYDGSGTHMRMVVYINGVAKSATSITTLTDPSTWYHIAGTYDGTDVKIYVDGTLEGTTVVLGDGEIDIGSEALGIGRNPEANIYGYKGFIDEVRIWNTALTEEQLGSVIVAIDIKPGSCPNPLNVKNQGVLPVAILGTQDFDVTQIDPATIMLEGMDPLRWAFEDVATPLETLIEGVGPCFNCTEEGPDGFLDLTLKFDTKSILSTLGFSTTVLVEEPLEIAPNDGQCVPLKLTGNLIDSNGTPIWGEDKVIIIRKGK
jgi:hypothetical protein